MKRSLTVLAVLGGSVMLAHGAQAASFDCSKAATPFEKAICSSPDLSKADETLAAGYKAALEGLSVAASASVKANQHDWLAFAQRACTHDAEPLKTGSYDEDGLTCLQSVFSDRADALASSQTIGGLRFYPVSSYDALKDEDATPDMPNWVGTNVMNAVRIDGDDATATGFNALVDGLIAKNASSTGGGSSEDITYTVKVSTVTKARIALSLEAYDFGHGAAHGNYAINTADYLIAEGRPLEASDVFTGKGWEAKLRAAVVAEITKEMGEDLQLDDPHAIDQSITDPANWDFSDAGFIVQFQPYEVAAYAVGAPTATVPWEDLKDITADGVEALKAN